MLPVPIRRLIYRCAYRVLQVVWFVTRPNKVGVKCVLTDGNLVLLVRHTYGDRDWDLPGGSIKRHEQPGTAARREMGEELGVRIDHWQALGEVEANKHHRRDVLHCFQAELSSHPLTIDHGELATARWFPRDALPRDLGDYVLPVLARAEAHGS